MSGRMKHITPYLVALILLPGVSRPVLADLDPSLPGPDTGFLEGPAAGGTIALNALDTGWYDQTGFHSSTNKNYVSGRVTNSERRDYSVFNLAGLPGPIVSAQLQLFNPGPPFPGFLSPKSFEIFTLFDSSTPIPTLEASQTGRTDIFADLGTGIPFGAQVVSAADNGTVVSVNLNPAGLAALNAAEGGQFAFGGAITTLDATKDDEYIFGFTTGPGTVQLVVTAIPEPSSLILMATGLVGLMAFRVSRHRWTAPAA